MADPGYKLPQYEGGVRGTGGSSYNQWLRKWTLTISTTTGGGGNSIVIGSDTEGDDLRMKFETRQATSLTPGLATITLYNLREETASAVIREYSKVNLQAGYRTGHYGIIFEGSIKQFKKGRESAVDTYLILYCADAEHAINKAIVNTVLPAGWTEKQLEDALVKSQVDYGAERGKISQLGGVLRPSSRPTALWGETKNEVENYKATTRKTWSLHNGKIIIQPNTAYAPGDIVVINSGTGMIGIPEVTESGIEVTCLLNANLFIKGRVQLDNRTFNQRFGPGGKELTQENSTETGLTNKSGPIYATTSNDGVYCIVVIEHHGDTRGLDWYTQLTCWSIDGSAPAHDAVLGQKEEARA